MARVIASFALLQCILAAPAVADDLGRDVAALEQIEIQGVSLSMMP